MLQVKKLYKCGCTEYFESEIPNCDGCLTRGCPYNTGFSEEPDIWYKEVCYDGDKVVYETELKRLYPDKDK